MTDQERKAACERAIQDALMQFDCLLMPTITTDTQGNLYRDSMGIRLVVLPETPKGEKPAAMEVKAGTLGVTESVDPTALQPAHVNGSEPGKFDE